jgi:hypothetical protein
MPADKLTSLQTDLASRYANQKVGGAFDAKNVKQQPHDVAMNENLFETDPKLAHPVQGVSNFKGVADGVNYSEVSQLAKGLKTTKYSNAAPAVVGTVK